MFSASFSIKIALIVVVFLNILSKKFGITLNINQLTNLTVREIHNIFTNIFI